MGGGGGGGANDAEMENYDEVWDEVEQIWGVSKCLRHFTLILLEIYFPKAFFCTKKLNGVDLGKLNNKSRNGNLDLPFRS